MNDLEAIELRKSRRSYLDTPIEQRKFNELSNLLDKYNAEADLSMSLIEDGNEAFNGLGKSWGFFKGVRTIIVLKGKKDDPNLKEKLGFYGEMIVLKATRLGLGSCWVGGSFDRNANCIKILEDEELVCVITVGNTEEELTFREKLIHGLTHRKTKDAEELYYAEGDLPQWFIEGIKAVEKAPSAMNAQPVKFLYKDGGVKAFVKETSKLGLVDLGIAKAHFLIASGVEVPYGI